MGVDPSRREFPGRGLSLDPLAEAVSAARRYVRDTLISMGRGDLAENARLGVSELVTNAALHARTPMTVTVGAGPTGSIRISVQDRSSVAPEQRRYGLTSATGRGLRILESVSTAWGVDALPADQGEGKVVWFEPSVEMTVAGFSEETWAQDVEDLL